jgi:photosystem II stability/assembly factor-like uncharacterized protein
MKKISVHWRRFAVKKFCRKSTDFILKKLKQEPRMNKKFSAVAFYLVLSVFVLCQYGIAPRGLRERGSERSEQTKTPNDWFFAQRAFPSGQINKAAHLRAVRQAQALRALQKSNAATEWKPIGPRNIGGRITALAVHPLDPNIIYLAAAAGGVFLSTDRGAHWSPIFDEQPSLSIGALAIDPNNPDVIYAGTGEANSSGDSYAGDGIYKSTDAGLTWHNIGLENSDHIGRIAIHPKNSGIIYVAACGQLFGTNAERGIYKTSDGGQTWERSLFLTDSTAAIDVVINPENPDTVYAAMWERIRSPYRRKVGGFSTGIYRTFDRGANWELLTLGLPQASATTGRIGLAIAPSDPATIYSIHADHPGNFAGIYKSTNHGDSWQRVQDGSISGLFSSFGWYFGNIKVDPNNANTIYALGVDFVKSTNGGNSWSSIRRGIHVDQHAIEFDPANSNRVFVGNDGGFYVSENGGGSWTKSLDLPITQFYAGTIDFLNPERSYGGTQDNGTMRTLTGRDDDWDEIYGGDGFYCLVDYTDARYVYAESQFGGLGRSTDGGNTFLNARPNLGSGERTNWSTPVAMDPNNPRVLYYGSNRLYRTSNRAVSWTAISPDLTNGSQPANLSYSTLTTIAVSSLDSNLIYVGADDAHVWVTKDRGQNWIDIRAGLPNRWVTRVAADPFDANVAYVTFSGHAENIDAPHVFRTSNQGATWSDISSNLPEAPINDIIIDNENPAVLYLGTDVGVFYSANTGSSWSVLGSGLPFSPVHDLTLHPITRTLRAATHGRSFYEFDLSTLSEVSEGEIAAPEGLALRQNFPNPISLRGNQITTIAFDLRQRSFVRLEVFDLLGRKIASLAEGELHAGAHHRSFEVRGLASGEYVYRLSVLNGNGATRVQSRRLTVVR